MCTLKEEERDQEEEREEEKDYGGTQSMHAGDCGQHVVRKCKRFAICTCVYTFKYYVTNNWVYMRNVSKPYLQNMYTTL